MYWRYEHAARTPEKTFENLLKLYRQILLALDGDAQAALDLLEEIGDRYELWHEGFGIRRVPALAGEARGGDLQRPGHAPTHPPGRAGAAPSGPRGRVREDDAARRRRSPHRRRWRPWRDHRRDATLRIRRPARRARRESHAHQLAPADGRTRRPRGGGPRGTRSRVRDGVCDGPPDRRLSLDDALRRGPHHARQAGRPRADGTHPHALPERHDRRRPLRRRGGGRSPGAALRTSRTGRSTRIRAPDSFGPRIS